MTPITSWNEDENCYFDVEQGKMTINNRYDQVRKTVALILVHSQKTQPGLNRWGKLKNMIC